MRGVHFRPLRIREEGFSFFVHKHAAKAGGCVLLPLKTNYDMATKNKSLYWLLFLVSFVAFWAMIFWAPQWFWLALPFWTTFLVKAADMI